MFISVKSIFPRFLRRIDQKSKIYNLKTEDVFSNLLKKELGGEISDFISVVKHQDGSLFIRCSNSSAASEIQLIKEDILKKVNSQLRYLNKGKVENIIFI